VNGIKYHTDESVSYELLLRKGDETWWQEPVFSKVEINSMLSRKECLTPGDIFYNRKLDKKFVVVSTKRGSKKLEEIE
jgi:hypothetical protein